MATAAILRVLSLAATCAGQVQEANLDQLYQLPPQPLRPMVEVGPYGAAQPPVAKRPAEQLTEMVSQMGERGFANEALYTRPQYYADSAHYMPEFARSAAAPGESPAQGGRLASVGGSAASFAAASNLQNLRGVPDDWRHGHEDLEQAISALRKYLENPQDQQFQHPQDQQQFQHPQEVLLQQMPQQPQLQQEVSWESPEQLLQHREQPQAPPMPEQPVFQNAFVNYDLARQASRPNAAALLELGSTESSAASLEFMERAFELVVAQHPGFVMVSSVVFGITLALCCILNRARLERGRQQLTEEPGQIGSIFLFLMFASSGFGVLWCYGLIQPYWKPLLVGGYVLLTIFWFAGLICLQVSKTVMDQRQAPKAEGWKLPWGKADSLEAPAPEARDVPQKRGWKGS